jgi:hypothetical protein
MALAALLAMTLLQAAEPTPVSPATVTAPKPAATGKKPLDPDEVICTREEVVGKLIPQRVCMTRAQREAMTQGGRDRVNDMQLQHPVAPPPSNGH